MHVVGDESIWSLPWTYWYLPFTEQVTKIYRSSNKTEGPIYKFMSQLEILCCSCGIASVRRGVLPRGYGDLYLGQDCIKLSHCDQPVLIVLSYMYINEWSVLFLFIWQLHHYYRNIKEIVIFRTSKQNKKYYNSFFLKLLYMISNIISYDYLYMILRRTII